MNISVRKTVCQMTATVGTRPNANVKSCRFGAIPIPGLPLLLDHHHTPKPTQNFEESSPRRYPFQWFESNSSHSELERQLPLHHRPFPGHILTAG